MRLVDTVDGRNHALCGMYKTLSTGAGFLPSTVTAHILAGYGHLDGPNALPPRVMNAEMAPLPQGQATCSRFGFFWVRDGGEWSQHGRK